MKVLRLDFCSLAETVARFVIERPAFVLERAFLAIPFDLSDDVELRFRGFNGDDPEIATFRLVEVERGTSPQTGCVSDQEGE